MMLNKPYPYSGGFKASVKAFVFISTFIFLFVFLFRSDVLTEHSSYTHRLLISFYFGAVTFIGASFNSFIFHFAISEEEEQNWKVWKEILMYGVHFLTISVSIFFLTAIVAKSNPDFSLLSLFKSVSSTVIVGAIPVSIHVINEQKKLFKKNYELAVKLEEENNVRDIAKTENTIKLKSEELRMDDIVYAVSNKNYINIILIDDKTVSIRMTIKELEAQFEEGISLVRCHRAYIVNVNKICKVEGNAQGLRLYLVNCSSYIPVSRSYIPKVDHIIRPNK